MKTNIKLRVTPEQSKAVQKICFANGINWASSGTNHIYTCSTILISKNRRLLLMEDTTDAEYTEVDADLFIRTNGTCEESIDIVDNLSNNKSKEAVFEQYGFEVPDFDCTILTKVNHDYVGYVIDNDTIIALSWSLSGTCYTGVTYTPKHNLNRIKKPWYETCKFPVLVWNEDNDLFAIGTRGEYTASYLDMCKPLSNEEIDQLKQDF